jgi:deoxyadenosine/deoxycytidine kinase
MSKKDFDDYFQAYCKIQNEIPLPDVIIFLRTSSNVLLERIKMRGRDYEKNIERDYLEIINKCYEEYVEMMHSKFGVEIIVIETSDQSKVQIGKNVSRAIQNYSSDFLPLIIA